ncbi:MAG TPA: HAMP domain-containing histidine kinase [Phycisphaerales bacterium]|nr:HAMP domain-containing histidine kinase [Phycisphaerales bacterium]
MFGKLRSFIDVVLRKAKLKPLSIGEKCRLQFGGAVLLILGLALMLPYFWMGKLTEKNALDSGRAIADMVFLRHFQLDSNIEKGLPALNETGVVRNPEELIVQWFRLNGPEKIGPGQIMAKQREAIDELVADEYRYDAAWIEEADGEPARNNYVRVVRAMDACIVCHNQQGTAAVFNKNEAVGAIVTRTPARDVARTRLMNRLWIIVAGLMAAAGAMVAFYSIAQRIILRPIRQLRALVSNVSEGNLDARSAIKSDDEYEKLSDAFNAMLDGLQESQEKLRQANKTLDGKIAQLSDRNIELFKANKLKSEFLANMSHEVRTPLNAILGFAQILREKPAGDIDKSRRYAENIITSGRALLNMINDLLDLAKAEAGKMRLHLEKTSILTLCQGLVAFYYAMAEQHRVTIELNVEDDIPLVTTDYGKVQQVLYNLLSNAIKFTPEDGKVVVSAKMLDEKTVRMSVTDTGPGIAEDNYDKVFEKFRQVDGSITRQGDGSGLGLAICKELTELLAGEISIESTLGEGSTFHLDIPLVLSVG